MTVLVTGAAGFIGYHLSQRLLISGTPVVGFDNVNPYYDPALKRARLAQLEATAKRTGSRFERRGGSGGSGGSGSHIYRAPPEKSCELGCASRRALFN